MVVDYVGWELERQRSALEALALGGQALVELAGCLCGGALAGVLSGGRKKKRSAARKK